jgi:hypothetical protein
MYRSKMPPSMRESTPLTDYYPVAEHFSDFLDKEDMRPGAGVLGALQAFYESTGGRTTKNIFGVKPKGKSGASFESIPEAIDYQYGPNVLSGGVADKLNILRGKKGKITPEEIRSMYASYNPEMAYIDSIISDYLDITEGGEK